MSHKYNKKIEAIEKKANCAFNFYWQNVSKKMAWKYFLECKILKKDCFKMTFPHSLGDYDERECKFYNVDFVRDSESLIEHYAARNGLEICDEKLTGSKSIYWFKKADVSKAE
jgi:hypothetical protein